MKKIIKRIAGLFLACSCIITTTVSNPTGIFAGEQIDFYTHTGQVKGELVFGQNYSFDYSEELYMTMTVPQRGYITVNVDKPKLPDTGQYQNVAIGVLDMNQNYVWYGDALAETWTEGGSVYTFDCGLAAGRYYICILPDGDIYNHLNVNCNINFTASNTYEIESNNTATTATPIELNTLYTGNFFDEIGWWGDYTGQYDYYTLSLKKGQLYRIYVSKIITDSAWLQITPPIADAQTIDNYMRMDSATGLMYLDYIAPVSGTYYLSTIMPDNIKPSSYNIGVYTQKIQTPKIKSKKISKSTMTVKYSKVQGATGYEIQYSTDKKFKNAKKVLVEENKTSAKISKINKSKKYYVRVRSYYTMNKMTVKSSWSK